MPVVTSSPIKRRLIARSAGSCVCRWWLQMASSSDPNPVATAEPPAPTAGAGAGAPLSDGARRRRYMLGIITLLCVVILWVASSSMIQSIFRDQNFNKPFFLTYFSTSLFTIYLIFYAIGEYYKKRSAAASRNATPATRQSPVRKSPVRGATGTGSGSGGGTAGAASATSAVLNGTPAVSTVTVAPFETGSSGGGTAELKQPAVAPKNGADANSEHESLLPTTPGVVEWGLLETARLAAVLCPLWFLMNYLFNLSLTLTSIASTTILSSTSGLFVVLLGFFALGDRLALANIIGVACTIGGAVLVSVRDYWEVSATHTAGLQQTESLHGDIVCCVSAFFYASYTVYLNYKVPDDRVMNIQLLFGLIGVINVCSFWPLFLILHHTGVETMELPAPTVILFLILNGLFGTVISDMLWAKSVLLTSPLIATIGLSLTIPLAMLADFILHNRSFTILYWMGSLLVLSGFVLVNWKFTTSIAPAAAAAAAGGTTGTNDAAATGAAGATDSANTNSAASAPIAGATTSASAAATADASAGADATVLAIGSLTSSVSSSSATDSAIDLSRVSNRFAGVDGAADGAAPPITNGVTPSFPGTAIGALTTAVGLAAVSSPSHTGFAASSGNQSYKYSSLDRDD